MAKYYVGIDLGTSSVRAFMIDFDCKKSYVAGENYDVLIPQLGYAEQDPQIWYEKTVCAIRRVLSDSSVSPDDIVAISFSGQMHGLVALDAQGQPVMNVPIWMDQRSESAIEEIYAKLGEAFVRENTQNRIATGFLLPSLYWLRTRQPEVYQRIAHVMLPKDYIKYRLSGRIVTDYSDAAGSLAFDNCNLRWADALIDALDLRRDLFPECLASTEVIGHVCSDAARDTGLSEKTLIVNGGSDQCMQAIGNAVIDEGVFACNIGTSSLTCTASPKPVYDPLLRTNTFAHALPGRWSVMGACLNGGSVLKWLTRQIYQCDDYEEINRIVAQRPSGSNGLFFLPYMAGERTPHLDPRARGVFFGLTMDHGRADMARALMEGVIFALKDGIGVLEEMGIVCKRIVAAGGGARSDVWLQMQADIFEKQVYRSNSKEQACLGAAMTAAVGFGKYASYEEACAACVQPSQQYFAPKDENVKIYRQMYPIFRELYTANKGIFSKIGDVFQVK